ncbi:MAG: low molecular weight protein arginine phosphatase [Clostridia bacterium]|nr:low molecular weight protein arginine phosphatase [Clostridia bacterium]
MLFVCTANTCRSPMAEAIFDELVDEHPRLRGLVKCESAGTMAFEGDRMAPYAQEALSAMGVDGTKHRSKRLNEKLVEEADLILTMEACHMDEVEALFPEAENKVHTLKGYVEGVMGYPDEDGSDSYNIEDPYRMPGDAYIEVAQELREAMEKLLAMLDRRE